MKKIGNRLALAVAISSVLGGVALPASASVINSWNTTNVITTTTLDEDGNGYSYIYNGAVSEGDAGSALSNGYIKFTPDESVSPGLEVENGATENCILASSDNSSCTSDFQTGKRFKLDSTSYGAIDLVFDVGSFDEDSIYKVFQKFGNNIGDTIDSFTIQTGFGVGADFISSTLGDGLGFVDFGDDPSNSEFSSLFAAGLFGTASERHPLDGYFSTSRAGFTLDMISEDMFVSRGMFGDYDDLFGDLLSYSMTPDGYFYDDDGDESTDAILMAHYDEESGEWILNRGLDSEGNVITLAYGNDGMRFSTVADIEAYLISSASSVFLPYCDDENVSGPCLAGVDLIEDLAKFNLTYSLELVDDFFMPLSSIFSLDSAFDDTFTLRITANAADVPTTGGLSLLLFGMAGLWLRNQRKS